MFFYDLHAGGLGQYSTICEGCIVFCNLGIGGIVHRIKQLLFERAQWCY